MRKFVLLLALGIGALTTYAQTAAPKIGYADVDYIFSQMPESKAIDAELKSTQAQLKNQIDTKYQEFQKKVQDYQANLNTMLEAVRQNTERELQQMQQNLEKLQTDAQTTIETKRAQLMDPVYKKVGKGIEDVAKENGFTFVFSQQIGGLDVILYGDEKMDVSDLVLKKLGVTPKPATATAPAQPKK
ncbi:OmpH family outer membrane protein [Chryseolinea sp. T2]|uniref:OmpH family outer membrane protein n=1 Tax=Chryseolinea sp. T2 TaxID=3129255 RepID=UPI003076ADD6